MESAALMYLIGVVCVLVAIASSLVLAALAGIAAVAFVVFAWRTK